MMPRRALMGLVFILLSVLYLGAPRIGPAVEPTPGPARARYAASSMMACSTSFSQISPCTSTVTKNVNTNNTHSYTVTNKNTLESQTFLLSCTKSGAIASCSTPASVVVNRNSSKSFTLSYLTAAAAGTGTITVTATGDFDVVNATLTVDVANPPPPPPTPFYLVDVTPDYQGAEVSPNAVTSAPFLVRNNGTTSEIYVIEKSCNGTGASCTLSTTEVTIGAGGSSTETIAYTAGGTIGSPGTVKLSAWLKSNTSVRDSGTVAVAVASKTPGLELTAVNPGTAIDRDLCLTVAAGSDAAIQCGDLRIVHALPATKTRNTTRTPSLIYSSQQAHPYPLVAAELTVTSDSVPQTVSASLVIGGAQYATGTWSGVDWTGGGTRRIAIGFDAQNLASGVYAYQLEVVRHYASGTRTHLQNGDLLVANRLNSQFGGGWWLAGLEQLVVGTSLLWIGADGSALKYSPHQALTNVWVTASLDRPDSISYDAASQVYTRWLPRKLRVEFNSAGQHVRTINRLGDTTRFWYGAAGRLDSLTLPPSSAAKTYRFGYDSHFADYRLSSVTAPPAGATSRVVTLTVPANQSIVTAITDPDGRQVSFAHDPGFARRITARTDRRGSVTTYTYGSASKVHGTSLDMGGGTFITATFLPAETRGFAGTAATAPPLAYAKLDGPRSDVGDSTLFWLDRFGAPARIRDAIGNETVVTRGDARWPALVTMVRRPNGQTTSAAYDSVGNIASVTDSSTWRDSSGVRRYATTTYEWDASCSHVTRVRQPEGQETRLAYDPTDCNARWVKSGRDSIEFAYFTSGVKRSLLSAITSLGAAASESVDYDGNLANVSTVTSPLGFVTTHFTDGIGRDTLIKSPIDAAGTQFLYERLVYDVVDQVVTDSVYATVGGQSLLLRNAYDAEGNLDTLKQLSIPDPNGIGWLIHVFQYDRANRTTLDTIPGFQAVRWSYDLAGNVVLGGRRPTANSYDALNRITKSIASPDTALFFYDASGQVVVANNGSARISRTYNPNGTLSTDTLRIKNVNYEVFSDHVYGLRFSYDLNGRRAWMKYASQLTPVVGGVRKDSVAYTYDPITGAIASVRDGFGNRYEWAYDNANRVSTLIRRLTSGDTIVETRRYDLESRPVRRIQQAPGSLLIHSDSLRYDSRGKVTKHVLAGDTIAYTALGHVSLASFNGAIESFNVDALGNRRSGIQAADAALSSTYIYQPGSGRQLDIVHNSPGPIDDTTFQSNATGDLTLQARKHYWTVDCGPGCKDTLREERRTRHEYNARGQLIETIYNFDSIPAPRYLYKPYRSTESFRYDALGRRVWRRIIRGSNCLDQDPSSGCVSAVDRFVWDGDEILHEIRAPGDSGASNAAMEADGTSLGYLHGTAIDEPLMIFKGTGVVLPYTNWRGLFDRATCPVAQCALNSPEFPAASAGTFGLGGYDEDGPSSWWGSLIEHGQDAHGLQYRRNRYYDPKTGRFTQEDPIGLAGGLNLYGFANGDPVNFSDPFGLYPFGMYIVPSRNARLNGLVVRMIEGSATFKKLFLAMALAPAKRATYSFEVGDAAAVRVFSAGLSGAGHTICGPGGCTTMIADDAITMDVVADEFIHAAGGVDVETSEETGVPMICYPFHNATCYDIRLKILREIEESERQASEIEKGPSHVREP